MLKSSTITVGCALCVGAAPEPYLRATLAAIADAVDVLAVNDNSGLAHSPNVAILEDSAFARDGRMRLERHPFIDFADMRNRAFAALATFDNVPDWVMFLDADEVHGTQIVDIARGIVPRLPRDTATLDGYTYHFWGTFDWISDVARRMAFYRYSPELHWENAVHERILGLRGRSIVVPYTYHHYGNVRAPRELAEKHGKYFELGNKVPKPVAAGDATLAIYLEKAETVRRYRAPHPLAARATVAQIREQNANDFAALDAAFEGAQATARSRARVVLAGAVEAMRVRLRYLERPGLYRLPLRAR